MKDILIVEDGLHERERLYKLFTGVKYRVSTAESAEEAEKLLAFEQFRLVILDIGLGDRSGSHLFDNLKRSKKPPFILILTGNPSISMKQRFLDEGAVAYVVKASPMAENEHLLATVRNLLGSGTIQNVSGMPLGEFLKLYVTPPSKDLFLESGEKFPACRVCGSREYMVTFTQRTQLPPVIEGRVVCIDCNEEMDPEVG